jgi:EmrB/QacA subfamily drug resistance transporter
VGGSLGDRLGRKRVYLAGAGAFAVASLVCGLAPNVPLLVVARAVQGVAGAFLVPGSLALIQTTFHPDDRARAIGAWSGLAGITTAIGPFLGGWLVEAASWRWVFLLNLPMAAVVILVGQRHLLESRDPTIEGRPDLAGAALGALGLAASTYGLIQEEILVGLVGLGVLAAFVVVEARTAHPMLPLGIFRSRQFSGANAVTLAVYAALAAVLFLLSLVLQQALGYSPLEAGAATVPLTLVMLALSSRSGALAQRIGPRIPMTLGPIGIAAGMVLMVRIDTGGTYLSQVLPALLVFSAGLVLTVAPLTSTVLAAADARHAGVASGVNNAVSRAAGLIAVAGLPIIAGFDASAAVGGETLVEGFHRATVVGAGAALVGAVVAWLTIRADVLEATGEDAAAVEEEAAVGPCSSCAVSSPPTQKDRDLA